MMITKLARQIYKEKSIENLLNRSIDRKKGQIDVYVK